MCLWVQHTYFILNKIIMDALPREEYLTIVQNEV